MIQSKHKLTIMSGYTWDELTIEFNSNSDTNDMITIFKTIAKFLTFSDDFLEYKD